MSQPRCLWICTALLLFNLSQAAMAGVITVSTSPITQAVEQGGSNYVLNFSITTTDILDLGAFNITVTAPDTSGITFTSGDASVASYVFSSDLSGLFLFGNPSIPNNNSGDISDIANSGNLSLGAGTYGLGRIFFSVAANAPLATVNINLDASTSFTNGLTFDPYVYTPVGGSPIATIEINPSTNPVPEPSMLVIMGIMSLAMLRQRPKRFGRS